MKQTQNRSEDVDKRNEHVGAAAGTPGLNALDQERESSLADEGGASGATVETQDPAKLDDFAADVPVAHRQADDGRGWTGRSKVLCAASTVAAAAIGVALYNRTR